MPVLVDILFVCLALLLLWKGSGWLVESAVHIAHHLGMSQLIIGITVVALGTSAPEFVVTVGAAIKGQSDISVSNVIGSNIFNLGFILGGVAIVQSIKSSADLIWRDGMILIATNLVLLIFIWDLQFTRLEGMILLCGLFCYIIFLFVQKRGVDVMILSSRSRLTDVLILVLSTGLVILGGQLLREGGVGIARAFGLSEWVIGATVIAAGTSAPEFATSLMASLKGHHGISAGNLIGSCIYNFLGVLGLAGVIKTMVVSQYAQSSIVMLGGLVLLAVIFLKSTQKLSRIEGVVLFVVGLIIWIIEFI